MTKTFKDLDGYRYFHVEEFGPHVKLSIEYPGNMRIGIVLERSVIPDVALAELHAAYPTVNLPHEIEEAKNFLLRHMELVQREAEEAKDLADLEAEALGFCNAWRSALMTDEIEWDDMNPNAQEQWIAVAKHSREMRDTK
ncbi:hypothetical protein [Glutamicibacter creatinolyticus]|uniref:hypothetical protein n=1 Tax=Glutamicibacter creatinolyticus TaxID=162496 RepID=UPI0031E3960D